jgi:hypothetical protein
MATNACYLLYEKSDIKAVMLSWQQEQFTVEQKLPKGVAGFRYKAYMDIF